MGPRNPETPKELNENEIHSRLQHQQAMEKARESPHSLAIRHRRDERQRSRPIRRTVLVFRRRLGLCSE